VSYFYLRIFYRTLFCRQITEYCKSEFVDKSSNYKIGFWSNQIELTAFSAMEESPVSEIRFASSGKMSPSFMTTEVSKPYWKQQVTGSYRSQIKPIHLFISHLYNIHYNFRVGVSTCPFLWLFRQLFKHSWRWNHRPSWHRYSKSTSLSCDSTPAEAPVFQRFCDFKIARGIFPLVLIKGVANKIKSVWM